jgi:hypothetical protein
MPGRECKVSYYFRIDSGGPFPLKQQKGKMRNFLKPVILATVLACTASVFGSGVDTLPDGSIYVGPTGSNFTVLSQGDFDAINDTFTGPSYIKGNVGIGGHGNFSASDGTIDGDIYMNSYGTFKTSGPFQHHGTRFNNADATLDAALNDANMLSDAAAMEASTYNYTYTVNGGSPQAPPLTTINTGQSMTITANPFSGSKVVLNLQDFVLTSGTFTLNGAANDTFIINVARNFSINNSSVVLAGGIMSSHVLFNVRGTGNQVSLNQGVHLWGILVALDRKVSLSGGRVHGRVYANQFAITSGGQVISE